MQIPNLRERIAQGGVVGYLILVLAGFAYALAAYRFVELTRIGYRVRNQLQSPKLRLDNPLGRVLARLDQLGLASPAQAAIILADARTSTGLLVKMVDQLRLAGFVNMSVAASTAPDTP
ncbi:hypothetical protein ACWJKU_01815 [Methylocaldum sp. MU1018]